jgi:hypothetical protein
MLAELDLAARLVVGSRDEKDDREIESCWWLEKEVI